MSRGGHRAICGKRMKGFLLVSMSSAYVRKKLLPVLRFSGSGEYPLSEENPKPWRLVFLRRLDGIFHAFV
jgi:hypothetical protein